VRIIFSRSSWSDYLQWQEEDRVIAQRINELISDATRHPFVGLGKPEPLRNEMSGWWSRRINHEHRLVYRVAGTGETQSIEIASCRFHYKR
jgi:toxin YoeB